MKTKKILFYISTIMICYTAKAQGESPLSIKTKRENGIEITQKDSLFSMQFQFRMQNRAGYLSKTEEDLTPQEMEFRVRRLRMRMKGFVISPKIGYYVQLSFSRGDMDWEDNKSTINSSPNIVRDAMIYYKPSNNFELGFGQTKLPGNRQRVISSGNLQFTDRSIVNATYTLDRDFGFFAKYEREFFNLKGAITSGEGRNTTKSDKGLNYTGRIEILPFGRFTKGNDECEGDLAREQKVKLVIAGGINHNENSVRQGGTLGNDLYSDVDVKNLHLDLMLKYKGFALYQEYCNRKSSNNVTTENGKSDSKIKTVYTGFGSLTQISYLFKNNYELAVRYANITPDKSLYENEKFVTLNEKKQEHFHLGVSKYIYGHRLKVQGNLLYQITHDLKNDSKLKQIGAILQIELGI